MRFCKAMTERGAPCSCAAQPGKDVCRHHDHEFLKMRRERAGASFRKRMEEWAIKDAMEATIRRLVAAAKSGDWTEARRATDELVALERRLA